MRVNWPLLLWSPLLIPVLWIIAAANAVFWVTMNYLNDVFEYDAD